MSFKTYVSFVLLLLLINPFTSNSQNLKRDSKDSILQFIFTSDLHFGLYKENFQNSSHVPAYLVNKSMANAMIKMQKEKYPNDGGVQSNQSIHNFDALVITGDIANRMETGIQSATKSWQEFKNIFVDSFHLSNSNNEKSNLLVVPGNHDMSNAIGFHRKMEPLKDPSSMLGIYNLMFPEKKMTLYDSSMCRVHYSKDIKGIHFIMLSLYPDSAERVWMEKDLATVSNNTPVLLFAHSIPDVEPRFFENPNGIHDINEQDKFENLVPERYKDGPDVKGNTVIEQKAFVNFLKMHPNIKAYFHGHENFTEYYTYKGPLNDCNLTCIRTDSPMKGRKSVKDETQLAFEIISINTHSKKMTVRELLWNKPSNEKTYIWGETISFSW